MPRLPGIVRLIVRGEATVLRPTDGSSDVALGQQQPHPLRQDRIEQAGRPRRCPLGFYYCVQRSGRIGGGLPDPCQRHQARGQRRGEVELPAQRDAVGDVPQGGIEVVALVCHLRQADIRDADRGQGRAAGRRGDLQRLLIGPMRGVQPALGALDLAEEMAAPADQGELAARLPLGDARRQRALGVFEPAAKPLGHRQMQPGDGVQQPLALANHC